MKEIHPSRLYLSLLLILFFNVCNVAIFSICEKVLMESHPDMPRVLRSKQHIGNPNSEANRCIGVYISDLLWHPF